MLKLHPLLLNARSYKSTNAVSKVSIRMCRRKVQETIASGLVQHKGEILAHAALTKNQCFSNWSLFLYLQMIQMT